MNSEKATQVGQKHSFENCPACGGRMEYQTRADVLCRDCGEEFTHENRGARHLLWSFTEDYEMNEIVARARNSDGAGGEK